VHQFDLIARELASGQVLDDIPAIGELLDVKPPKPEEACDGDQRHRGNRYRDRLLNEFSTLLTLGDDKTYRPENDQRKVQEAVHLAAYGLAFSPELKAVLTKELFALHNTPLPIADVQHIQSSLSKKRCPIHFGWHYGGTPGVRQTSRGR
jgi:hypothetical protein